MNKRRIIAAFLIFALTFILRLIAIQTREIFYDDAFSLFLAEKGLNAIISGTAADTMPPLYYFYLHIWQLGGQGLGYLRLSGVLLSMAILGVSFDLFRRALGWNAALAGTLILAVSPLQIYHAQELRMYTLLVFGQVAYMGCFYRIFGEERTGKAPPGLWVGLIVSGAVAMYSHNLAIFGLAAANVFLLLRREWRSFWRLCLAQAAIGVMALPWLWMIPGQIEKIQTAFWTPRPGVVEVLQAVIQMAAFLPVDGIWLYIVAILALQIVVLTILEVIKGIKTDKITLFFLVIALFTPLALFGVSYVMRPVFVPRGFMLTTVALAGLSGSIIARRWRQGVGPLLLGLWMACAAISLPFFYTFNVFPRSPYREAVTWLQDQVKPGDVIIHENKLSYFPAYYYDRNLEQVFIADEPGSHNDTYAPVSQQAIGLIPEPSIAAAAGDSDRVYFVVFTQAIEEYETLGGEGDPNLAWLSAQYPTREHQIFKDLEIFLFER